MIDTQGNIRYDHIGEGSYDQIEKAIQSQLAERAALMGAKEITFNTKPSTVIKPGSLQYVDLKQSTTPEIYIGYNTTRMPLGNPEGFNQSLIQISNLILHTLKVCGKTIQIIWNYKMILGALF